VVAGSNGPIVRRSTGTHKISVGASMIHCTFLLKISVVGGDISLATFFVCDISLATFFVCYRVKVAILVGDMALSIMIRFRHTLSGVANFRC
jgi:hypothetical protein